MIRSGCDSGSPPGRLVVAVGVDEQVEVELRRVTRRPSRRGGAARGDRARRGRPRPRARRGAGRAAGRTPGRPASGGCRGRCARRGVRRRPSSTMTRSARTMASSTSWVTSSTAGRCTSQSLRSSVCIRIRVSASRAPKGSSASSSSGSRTSDRARAARCCSPPESSWGQAFSRPASPTSSSACRPRSEASLERRPRVTLSRTRFHGSSRESWKTTDTFSGTSTRPVPATPRSRPARERRSVLLPEPLRPSSATNSPGAISRSRPLSTPPASLKLRCRSLTRTAGPPGCSARQCATP